MILKSSQSNLKTLMQVFPFKACCTFLHSNGVGEEYEQNGTTTNDQNTLFSWVGKAIHQGSQTEKALVYKAIVSFTNLSASHNIVQPRREPFPQHELHTGSSPTVPQNGTTSPPHDLPKYSSLLQRFADHNYEALEFDEIELSAVPPSHRCQIKFRGLTGEGVGPQKKVAKHKASFDMCQKLNIRPDWNPE